MSEFFEENLANIRGKRQFIALVVNELLEISEYNAEMLSSIPWNSIASLPQWCVFDAEAQQQFRDGCGAVYLAPIVRKVLDGSRLVQFREAIGVPAFRYLFSNELGSKHSTSASLDLDTGRSMAESISLAGTSVILSSLNHDVAEELYSRKYSPFLHRLDQAEAREICGNAHELIHETEFGIVRGPTNQIPS